MSKLQSITDNWLIDEQGNRCSIEEFGSYELALEALESLEDCQNCVNCINCINCNDCSYSYQISNCINCHYCWGCYSCINCLQSMWVSKQSNITKTYVDNQPSFVPKAVPNLYQKMFKAITCKNLNMSRWHDENECGTTHCRAGWIVALAGEEGTKLEAETDTALAAMLIYEASGYKINPCKFFTTEAVALADIKRLAELEAASANE